MRRLRLRDGLGLRVEERGSERSGTPVLLLHGFTGSVEAWGDEIPGRLARRRPVVAVDLPGHGRSDVPSTPARTALEEVARDLADTLQALGHERAIWVGYSMGGRVALGGAVLHPERVAGLVLESASPGLPTAGEREARRARDQELARSLERDGLEAFVDRWMDIPLFRSRRKLSESVLAAERRRRLGSSVEGLASSLRGLGTGSQPSFWNDLAGVELPSLILTGEEDEKFTRLGDRMAERLPDARRVRVPEAGHAVHLEAPGPWLEAVKSFVGAVDDG